MSCCSDEQVAVANVKGAREQIVMDTYKQRTLPRLRPTRYLTVMMPTANLRSDGTKLFREVYLCILRHILLANTSQLRRLRRPSQQASPPLGHGAERLPSPRCIRERRGEGVVVRRHRQLQRAEKSFSAQSFHKCPRIHTAPLTTHQTTYISILQPLA